MAGFFGMFDYTKEGKGVAKDGPQKARITVFFEILGRKFWNLIKVNLMFLLFNIPALIIGLLIMVFFSPYLLAQDMFQTIIDQGGDIMFQFAFPIAAIFMCLPIITTGPAQAGMTYVLRNYAREEHAFIWSDFKEHALLNFKQSAIVSAINTVLFFILFYGVIFYLNMVSKGGNLLWSVATGLLLVTVVLFCMVTMYIYPLMVTFEYTIKQLYTNSFIFAMAKFLPNLIMLIFCMALVLVSFTFNPLIGYALFIFITPALITFMVNFYVYPKMKTFIMDKIEDTDSDKDISTKNDTVFHESKLNVRDKKRNGKK